jgi:glycosyltransferase involved in cell wall biosynthesis
METGPLVTVVVPTKNTARTLERCLASVRAQTYPNVELIVVDNRSNDATMSIAEKCADQALTGGPERSAQRNQGWRAGKGSYAIFIDADMVLGEEIVGEVAEAFEKDGSLGAVVLPELAFGEGFLARCRELEKRLYLGDPRVEAARAFPRPVLEKTGGYDEAVTGFEDWELPDRVKAAGYRVGRINAVVMHDEGRISLRRAFAKKRYYGHWLPMYRKVKRAAPARGLARPALLNQPLQLLRSPHHSVGPAVLKGAEWSGMALGAFEGRRGKRP